MGSRCFCKGKRCFFFWFCFCLVFGAFEMRSHYAAQNLERLTLNSGFKGPSCLYLLSSWSYLFSWTCYEKFNRILANWIAAAPYVPKPSFFVCVCLKRILVNRKKNLPSNLKHSFYWWGYQPQTGEETCTRSEINSSSDKARSSVTSSVIFPFHHWQLFGSLDTYLTSKPFAQSLEWLFGKF